MKSSNSPLFSPPPRPQIPPNSSSPPLGSPHRSPEWLVCFECVQYAWYSLPRKKEEILHESIFIVQIARWGNWKEGGEGWRWGGDQCTWNRVYYQDKNSRSIVVIAVQEVLLRGLVIFLIQNNIKYIDFQQLLDLTPLKNDYFLSIFLSNFVQVFFGKDE